ncbi:phage baseplate assembly protein V [Streptomyces sp. NPDC005931]|uniref:phage baseplate assembly protein V n=1 Tax=Streptomyces sp. NPDC005931 TaxID=3364737 RepID=UPI0036811954
MGLLDSWGEPRPEAPETDSLRHGVVRAEVTDNLDLMGTGRVRVKFPTIPDIEPWAAVCAPFAGNGYGMWCMPQVGDIVIVAFEHGDITCPVVVGSVWDARNRPPAALPTDAVTKRMLRTPGGHELVLDDLEAKVTLTHLAGHSVTLSATGITLELAGGAGTVKLALPGEAIVSGKVSATVSGARTSVGADTTLELRGATTSLQASATCQVKGGLVTIN